MFLRPKIEFSRVKPNVLQAQNRIPLVEYKLVSFRPKSNSFNSVKPNVFEAQNRIVLVE